MAEGASSITSRPELFFGNPHEEEEILDPHDLIQRYEEQRASLNAEIDRVLAEITDKLGGNKDEQ